MKRRIILATCVLMLASVVVVHAQEPPSPDCGSPETDFSEINILFSWAENDPSYYEVIFECLDFALTLDLTDAHLTYVYTMQAAAYDEIGRHVQAQTVINRALAIEPDSFTFSVAGANAMYLGDYEQAVTYFTETVDRLEIEISSKVPESDLSPHYINLGEAYLYAGDESTAEEAFAFALEHGYLIFVVDTKARYYEDTGQPHRAIEVYTSAIAEEPNNVTLIRRRGFHWYDIGDYEAALADLNLAIEIDSTSEFPTVGAYTYYVRGLAHSGLENQEAAMSDFKIAVDLAPNNLEYRHRWGNAALYADKPDIAIEVYLELLQMGYDDPAIFAGIAIAYSEMGEHASALSYYIAYRELASAHDDPFLKQRIAELEQLLAGQNTVN